MDAVSRIKPRPRTLVAENNGDHRRSRPLGPIVADFGDYKRKLYYFDLLRICCTPTSGTNVSPRLLGPYLTPSGLVINISGSTRLCLVFFTSPTTVVRAGVYHTTDLTRLYYLLTYL